jgi:hypothetical protein
MFHDLRLMPDHGGPADRFEVDGANTARALDYLPQEKNRYNSEAWNR